MNYIIVWKNNYREPFIDIDFKGFKETYPTYESAKQEAEKTLEQEGPNSEWYFDYKIYEEANS